MKITLLGTGSSTGTPQLLCDCPVCRSDDVRNRRSRYGILVRTDDITLLVDASFEVRQQLLDAGVSAIDGVWLTHAHSDHIAGIDDLRIFSFRNGAPLPLFTTPQTREILNSRFRYLLAENEYMERPFFTFRPVGNEPVRCQNTTLTPLLYNHGETVVCSFRIGGFAFVSDVSDISSTEKAKLTGLSVLVINATVLHPHYKHMCLDEVVALCDELRPEKVYLMHMNHRYDYSEIQKRTPDYMSPGYDGQVIDVSGSE